MVPDSSCCHQRFQRLSHVCTVVPHHMEIPEVKLVISVPSSALNLSVYIFLKDCVSQLLAASSAYSVANLVYLISTNPLLSVLGLKCLIPQGTIAACFLRQCS